MDRRRLWPADSLSITNLLATKCTLKTGAGMDTVAVDHIMAGSISVDLGAGTDFFRVDSDDIVATTVALQGGAGKDTLRSPFTSLPAGWTALGIEFVV